MKKKFIYLLACALALPLIAGCGKSDSEPTPTPTPTTYKVILENAGHIEVDGKKEGLLAGEGVSLTIRATDSYILASNHFRLYENTEDKTNVQFTWIESSGKLNFTMPAQDVVFAAAIRDEEYDIVLDQFTHLDGGDVEVNGVKLHFDENMVNENCENGFVEIAPYGSLCLETYLPGITKVYAEEIYDGGTDGGFFLDSSATPNVIDGDTWYTQTSHWINMSPDAPYFMLKNRDIPTVFKCVKIKYLPIDPEKVLRELIQVEDLETTFSPSEHLNPYEVNPLDESKIPENRIVEPIEPLEYTEPGEYLYGYEVYTKTNEGKKGKLLYSSQATCKLAGTSTIKHWAVFHVEDHTEYIAVGKNQKVDLSLNPKVSGYNWKTPYNDFETPFTEDRHFYPEYSIIGLPNHKNGDGCEPLKASYNGFDRHIDMPDPDMMDGYTFGGWYMDFECTQPFDPDAAYSGNLVLYAKCLEEVKNYRKVLYYDYDGTMLNRIDLLEEKEGAKISLPTFDEIGTRLGSSQYETRMYEVRLGAVRADMLRPEGEYPLDGAHTDMASNAPRPAQAPLGQHYDGDTLNYDDIKDYHGDIKLIVTKVEVYGNPLAAYTLFWKDIDQQYYDGEGHLYDPADPTQEPVLDHNYVASGFTQDEVFKEGDRILTGRYLDWNEDWSFDFTTYYDPQRCDEFAVTDEVKGYIIDQGSYNSIAAYGYGNKHVAHSKPLEGILRHDSVIKVNRRAFFNRYGLKGTYFPKNAREFALESYANVHFNKNLLLPKNLSKIGDRAFVGSTNIETICLPKSLKSVGKGAFSLADYDDETYLFSNVHYREGDEKIIFYYEGNERDFKALDDATKLEITSNASKIIYNVDYTPYYGK